MKEIKSVDVVCNVTHVGQWFGSKTKLDGLRNSARELVREIKKHCAYYEEYELKYNWVCSFCGDNWENSLDERGCPICCNKALREWEIKKRGEE